MSKKRQFRLRDRAGFTLVEIMIVVGIITLLAALALPGMLRARKRAQASRVKDDLRLIEAAVDQYAIETQRQPGWVVSVPDWTAYLKKETHLCTTGRDVLGHDFGSQTVDQIPTVPPETYAQLDRKSTRLNSSHVAISYAVFCLKKKKKNHKHNK